MPLKIASILKKPCKIVLAFKEESMMNSDKIKEYHYLSLLIEKAIYKISKKMEINTDIINTSKKQNDALINKIITNLKMKLTEKESLLLFNFFKIKKRATPNYKTRILVNTRVVACHSIYFMKDATGFNNFLIVEDFEQSSCPIQASKFENVQDASFLAFLPLPNIFGSACMFRSNTEERFLLSKNRKYYENVFMKSPAWVLNIYKELFRLVNDSGVAEKEDFEWFLRVVNKISSYFE